MKTIETKRLNSFRKSLTATSFSRFFNPAIVEYQLNDPNSETTIVINENIYKRIRDIMLSQADIDESVIKQHLDGRMEQDSPRQTPGLFSRPKNTPWGKIQDCDTLCTGVFMVMTPEHGGTMVSNNMTAVLSPAARKCGFQHNGYLCFNEDYAEDVVFRELLDKKLWTIPDRIKDKAAYEENMNNSIREHNPEYWRARQRGRETAQSRHAPAPARHAEL